MNPTTNTSSGASLVGATGNATATSSGSASSAMYFDGFRDFSAGLISLLQSTDTALTNAGVLPPQPNQPAATNSPAAATTITIGTVAALAAIGAILWYVSKR